ncbi:hypothetical protein NKI09_15475 [Mesorhizobium sp. M0757]|uniref:hypothetical protein n=1 Tax=Mesorhizobium sp. M0757 TaxID=2956993 RepID=UPI003339AA0C
MITVRTIGFVLMACIVVGATSAANAGSTKLKGSDIKRTLLGNKMRFVGTVFGGFSGVIHWTSASKLIVVSGTFGETAVSNARGTWKIDGDRYCRRLEYGDQVDDRCLSIYKTGDRAYKFYYHGLPVSVGTLE